MRGAALLIACVSLASCAPEVNLDADLRQASGRAQHQTAPASIPVYAGDVEEPYDVLGDVEVIVRQQSALGEEPTRDDAVRALREQAGRLGAHAIVMLSFGEPGVSFWSYHELRAHGRAIRYR